MKSDYNSEKQPKNIVDNDLLDFNKVTTDHRDLMHKHEWDESKWEGYVYCWICSRLYKLKEGKL